MPTPDAQAQVTISDYSPGIYASYHSGSSGYGASASTPNMSVPNNGAATIANTYGCCADPSTKWLVPLPRATAATVNPGVPGGTATMRLLDAIGYGPIFFSAGDVRSQEQRHAIYAFNANNGGGSNVRYVLARSWPATNASKKDWLYVSSIAALPTASQWPIAQLSIGRSSQTGVAVPVDPNVIDAHIVWNIALKGNAFQTGAIAVAEQFSNITFGTDNTAVGWNWTDLLSTNGKVGIFPKSGNNATRSVPNFTILTSTSTGFFADTNEIVVVHQGRIVSSGNANGQDAMGFSDFVNVDLISYSAVDQYFTNAVSDGVGMISTLGEAPPGIGIMHTLNASDLLVVKHQGGGAIFRGGIQDPTIIRLPNIESTHGVAARPVNVPGIGAMYATRNGVFAFDGQSTTKKVSNQLDGYFWQYEDPAVYDPVGLIGRMAFFHPWVMVPNDYMFDTRTGGWWRLTNPAAHNRYSHYDVGPRSGRLTAWESKVTPTYTNPYDTYTQDTLALSYSWQSQPLFESQDKMISFSTIDLVVQTAPGSTGNSVKLTFSGYDADGTPVTPVSETFAINTVTPPQFFERNMHPEFQARYVQVRVEASATAGAAPSTGPITIGIRPERIPPRT